MSEIVLKYICPVSDIIFTEDFLFMRIQLSEHFTYRKLLRFTLPSVIMMVCTSIYGVVDGVFVSNFVGSDAFAAVNLIMPFLMVLGAVGFMLGTGGSALVAYTLGAGNEKRANEIFSLLIYVLIGLGAVFTIGGIALLTPMSRLLGADEAMLPVCVSYGRIVLLGLIPYMLQNTFQSFLVTAERPQLGLYVTIAAGVTNIVLDPLLIFGWLGLPALGIAGAAIATVISQCLSAAFVVFFLTKKSELKLRFLHKNEIPECTGHAKNILSLGAAGFIMQLTNSLVTICCNNILSVTGGDIYISVMTIISSVRQLVETPIHAMVEGTSPILSYNYGARRPGRVRKSILIMSLLVFGYTAVMWSMIILIPETLIRIFSSDAALIQDAVPALNMYFAAFIFMDLQYIGQAVFKSLNKKVFAIFFSLLRKVIIVIPITYLLPYAFHMGTDGVFLAEPISNIIGSSLCFLVMIISIRKELRE